MGRALESAHRKRKRAAEAAMTRKNSNFQRFLSIKQFTPLNLRWAVSRTPRPTFDSGRSHSLMPNSQRFFG